MDREAVCRYLAATNIDHATLQFCERFDGKSRIWNFSKHSHPFFELIFFLEGKANIDAGDESGRRARVRRHRLSTRPRARRAPRPPAPAGDHLPLGGHRADADLRPCHQADGRAWDPALAVRDGVRRVHRESARARPSSSRATCRRSSSRSCSTSRSCRARRRRSSSGASASSTSTTRATSTSTSWRVRWPCRQATCSGMFKKKMQVTPMHYRNMVRIDKAKLPAGRPADHRRRRRRARRVRRPQVLRAGVPGPDRHHAERLPAVETGRLIRRVSAYPGIASSARADPVRRDTSVSSLHLSARCMGSRQRLT